MRIYCINLDRRPDRLDYIRAECARHDLSFERVPAVDGSDPEVAAAAARMPPTSVGERMSPAAYGCLQSHLEAWRRLIESGESHALVIEDDIVLADGIAQIVGDASWIPPDADIVKVETFGIRVCLGTRALPLPDGRELRRLGSFHHGAGAYILSAEAARRLRDEVMTGEPIDVAIFDPASPPAARSVIYQMRPAPVIQGDRAARAAGTSATVPDWARTSITARFETRATLGTRPEGVVGRLRRRLTEELRARLGGMRYLFVPHG